MARHVGELLARVRKKQRRTQSDIARAIGKSNAYICDIEKGRRGQRIDQTVLIKWADYLQIPITTVLIGAGIIDADYEARYGQYIRILRSKIRAQRIGTNIDGAKEEITALRTAVKGISPSIPGHTTIAKLVKTLENRILDIESTLTYGCVLIANLVLWGPYVT